jgi:prevent-host-death family protein
MPKTNKPVPVAELKARLSEYLRRVRRGDEVIISDRGVPIARLSPLGSAAGFDALVSSGIARAPQRPLPADFWDLPRAADKTGRLVEILLEERTEGP